MIDYFKGEIKFQYGSIKSNTNRNTLHFIHDSIIDSMLMISSNQYFVNKKINKNINMGSIDFLFFYAIIKERNR